MVDRFGPEKLMELYAAANGINGHEAFSAAFEKTFGIPLTEFEEAWHQRMVARYR
jgi:hypothetical protein